MVKCYNDDIEKNAISSQINNNSNNCNNIYHNNYHNSNNQDSYLNLIKLINNNDSSTSNNNNNNNNSIKLIITILPWINEPQEIVIKNLDLEIGDIVVFSKERGNDIKIRNLVNYNLYKLITEKKKLLLSYDQTIKTYNLIDGQKLNLIPVNNSNNNGYQLPRWFYKVIVPSNELEGILRDLNSHLDPNREPLLLDSNRKKKHYDPFHALSSRNAINIHDIIQNIKSNKLLTIDSPKRAISTSFNGNNNNSNSNNNNNNSNSYSESSPILNSTQQLNNSPVSSTSSSLSNNNWNYTIPSSMESPINQSSTNNSWCHARRVYDVVQKIESEFPYVLDNTTIDSSMQPEDTWEARVNSSDETFIKTLSMQDSIGSELSKQEYIDFSLRFENRTCLLLGIDNSFIVWIDPIQSFFTIPCSSNTTIRDVVYTILQYLFPSSNNSNISSNSNNSNELETFMTMVPYYALYLQESTTNKLLPLQHKQLLTNCNYKSMDSIFVFKKKKNLLSKSSDIPQPIKNIDTISNNTSPHTLDEDEGYNLTVLFPTKLTYRQFHFIPTRTVNETIKTILDSVVSPQILNNQNSGNVNNQNGNHSSNHNNNQPLATTLLVSSLSSSTTTSSTISSMTSTIEIISEQANNLDLNNTLDFENLGFEYLNDNSNNNYSYSKSPVSSPPKFNNSPLNKNKINHHKVKVITNQQNLNNQNNRNISNNNQSYIFENQSESQGYCLYFQKNGSGVWMEGNRTLISYNLPNETVVEFKPQPKICKISLIEGIKHTIKLYCKSQCYTIVYGKFTSISELEELLSRNIDGLSKKESESYGLFLIKKENSRQLEISLSSYLNFQELPIEITPYDYLEFKESHETNIDNVAALAFAAMKDPPLIPGEVLVSRREGQRILHSSQYKQGIFMLTNFRLIYHAINRSSYVDLTKEDCDIPITTILKVRSKDNYTIEIQCKNFKVATFYCQDPTIWNSLKSQILQNTAITKTFAFKNFEIYDKSMDVIYNIFEEFERLEFPKDKWRITHCNFDYSLCPTYPSMFIVPADVSDEQLRKVAQFREKGRVPAICWIHKNHNSTITRCSQPRVGLVRARSMEDEEYLNIITKSNSNSSTLYVMDSRPMANAKANTLLGKGHENTSLYQNMELQFLGIGNIHVMRDSYKKLYMLIQNQDSPSSSSSTNWFSQIDSTQWLEHIYQLINSSNMVVELVDKKGSSVLTHCSDGWDRTSQLVALSQLLLDPYYRTIKGFEILIEKEWLSFGHLFTTRSGHIVTEHGDDEFSPIFLMFIDAVWQLTCLLPTTFQFNERFLIKILDSVYDCRYKTFLFNNERERLSHVQKNQSTGGLVSLWSVINSNVEQYVNAFFIPDPKPIYENFFIGDIQFWSNYYMRWSEKYKSRPQIDLNIIKEIEKLLKYQNHSQQNQFIINNNSYNNNNNDHHDNNINDNNNHYNYNSDNSF